MPIKLRPVITLKQSKRIAELYSENLDQHLEEIVKIIAVNDDGSEIQNTDELAEDEVLEVFGDFIEKKNRLRQNFLNKMQG